MIDNPPTPERLLRDSGRTKISGNKLTIVNKQVNVPNFQLHSTTIHQLEKNPFIRNTNEDANKHLQRFLNMSTILKIYGHIEESKKLRTVPFTLEKDVEEWFYTLPSYSITTWEVIETTFMNEYFPTLIFVGKRYEILNLKLREGESLRDPYNRFKRLLVACNTHNLNQT